MPVASRVSNIGAAPGAAGAWPSTGAQQARKPAGGFIDCPVEYLTLPWWVYQQGAMGLDTLRVWLGTLELVEKRCCTAPEAPVHYSPEELRRLLRAPRLAPVTTGLQQLEELGLLAWSPQAIQFLPQAQALREALGQDGYQTLRAQLAPGLRWVPVPRRLLVWLAQEGQPGVIATALGVLLRCMRYKARQCVAGGRVATPWIASVFGVAERTVQRAMQVLQGCGWLARLAVQPARERAYGRYTVINLAWERPGAAERPRPTPHAAAPPEEPAMATCQNLSPVEGVVCANLSPIPAQGVPLSGENTESCGAAPLPALSQPFQEANLYPEPTGCRPTGTMLQEEQSKAPESTPPSPDVEDEPVSEDDYATATTRLMAQGTHPAFLIRPVVLAEVQRIRQEAARCPDATPGQTPEVSTALEATPASAALRPAPAEAPAAPAPSPSAPPPPQAPCVAIPACARPPSRMPPPLLRDVTLADLSDVSRLLALHPQAVARGWLRGGEAAQLTIVAAAVHAQRVGEAPCRLFVALLRDQRWEVITQDDEDQARRLLREHRDGPLRRRAVEACAPVPDAALSDDARFVLLAPQVLRQAGWRGKPFLAVKMQDPTWTRDRWETAQAELAQWRLRQAQQRRSLRALGAGWGEAAEDETDLEGCEADEAE